MMRLEAQNDFLNKERLLLETKLAKMIEENRTKIALRGEINALKQQNVILKDKIHEYEQLMEQNVQKLERVRKIRERDLASYEEAEKQRISQNNELEEKLDGLEALVQTLTSEKGLLQKKIENAEQTIAAYSSDKRNFSEVIESAAQQKMKILSDKQELENRLNLCKNDLMDRNNKISKLQSGVEEANKQSDILRQRCMEINQRLDENKTLLQEEKDKVAQLEIDLVRKNNELEGFENTKLHYEKRITNLESSLQTMMQKDKDRRNELEGSSHENSKLEAMVNAARSESEFLKQEVKSFTDQLQKAKAQIEKIDSLRRESISELKGLEQKNDLLRREKANLNDIIQRQENEINTVNAARAESDKKLIELTGKKEALDHATQKVEELQSRILQLESDKLQALGEKEQALLKIQKLEIKLNSGSETLNDETTLRKKKEGEIGDLKDEVYRLTLELKRKEEELRLSRQVEEEYNNLLGKNTDLEIRLQKTEETRRNNNILIDSLQKSIQQKENLLTKANEQIAIYTTQVNEEKRNTMSNGQLACQLNEKVKSKELIIDELRGKIAQREERIKGLEERIIGDEDQTKSLNETIGIQTEKLRQMQALIINLENSNEELVGRLKTQHENGLTSDHSLKALQDQTNSHKTNIANLEADLKIARDALININQERDEMQLKLDEKTQILESIKQKYELVFNELAQFKTLGVQKDGQNQQFSFRIEQRKFDL